MNFGFGALVEIMYTVCILLIVLWPFSRGNVNMAEQNKQANIWTAVIISAAILAAATIVAGCKKEPAEPSDTVPQHHHDHNDHKHPPFEPAVKSTNEPVEPNTKPAVSPKISLSDVIRSARTWRPAYTSWYGKTAPDFTLTDLDGKEHKLSDYRGKDVMLVFWATWCPPCMFEIPHLIALRNTVSEDKLAILAISNQKPNLVKKSVAQKKINYVVLLEKNNMPAPFGVLRIYKTTGIPCSFFINPDGKIKLATSGLLSLGYMKAILEAE
jgi:peroxiredoxin